MAIAQMGGFPKLPVEGRPSPANRQESAAFRIDHGRRGTTRTDEA